MKMPSWVLDVTAVLTGFMLAALLPFWLVVVLILPVSLLIGKLWDYGRSSD